MKTDYHILSYNWYKKERRTCVCRYICEYIHACICKYMDKMTWGRLKWAWQHCGMGKRKNRKSSVLFGTSVLSKHVSHGNTPRTKESYLHMVHPSSCHQWGWRTGSVLFRRHFCLCCLKTDGPGPNPNVNQKKQKDNVCFSLVSRTDVTFNQLFTPMAHVKLVKISQSPI